MNWAVDCSKHAGKAAEARKRIADAAALNPATADADMLAIAAAGARAAMWLLSTIEKPASTALLDELIDTYDTPTVARACIALCRDLPPGPAIWLRAACAQSTTRHPKESSK